MQRFIVYCYKCNQTLKHILCTSLSRYFTCFHFLLPKQFLKYIGINDYEHHLEEYFVKQNRQLNVEQLMQPTDAGSRVIADIVDVLNYSKGKKKVS